MFNNARGSPILRVAPQIVIGIGMNVWSSGGAKNAPVSLRAFEHLRGCRV
jgi:hypothetical protein